MYTSDINMKKTGFIYLAISLFCMVFGGVYEYFSHEVYSFYMIYAFVFPLIGGAVLVYAALFLGKTLKTTRISFNLWNSAIAAFTAGSIMKGILDIYGTTNKIITLYPVIGVIAAAGAFISYFLRKIPAEPI
ncbi:MAG: hypothetical protein LUH47_04780 [Clostridiales bacterium]|nr:hypothetical protein [Clostridiales bacterium]